MDAFFAISATLMVTSLASIEHDEVESIIACEAGEGPEDCHTLIAWLSGKTDKMNMFVITFLAVARWWRLHASSCEGAEFTRWTVCVNLYVPLWGVDPPMLVHVSRPSAQLVLVPVWHVAKCCRSWFTSA